MKPKEKSKVLTAGIIMSLFGIGGLAVMFYALRMDSRLLREGVPATAKVLQLVNHGNRVDGHEYWAELEVDAGDGTTVHLEMVQVAVDLARQGGVGSTWKVLLLPDRPGEVFPRPELQDPREQAAVRWVLFVAASGMLAGGVFFLFRWFRQAPGS